jgi:hypothetical protein
MRCLKCLSAALLVLSVVVVADAAPWKAGYKVFHQDGQATVSRRSYSYAPTAAAPMTAAPAAAAPVAAPAVTNAPAPVAAPSAAPAVQSQPRAYRSNSYQPSYNYGRANNRHAQFWKEARN